MAKRLLLLLLVLGTGYHQNSHALFETLRKALSCGTASIKSDRRDNQLQGNNNSLQRSTDNHLKGNNNELSDCHDNRVWGDSNHLTKSENNHIWGNNNTSYKAYSNFVWGNSNQLKIRDITLPYNNWIFGNNNRAYGDNNIIIGDDQAVFGDGYIKISWPYKIGGAACLTVACLVFYIYTPPRSP